jgi:hypothetical protein
MPKKPTDSLHESKTHLSAIVRRIRSLIDLGVITPPAADAPSTIGRVGRKPGALRRFLEERD